VDLAQRPANIVDRLNCANRDTGDSASDAVTVRRERGWSRQSSVSGSIRLDDVVTHSLAESRCWPKLFRWIAGSTQRGEPLLRRSGSGTNALFPLANM
jgi:hypothetical protein